MLGLWGIINEAGDTYTTMAIDKLNIAMAEIQDQAKGGRDGADWKIFIPEECEQDQEKVFQVGQEVLGEIKGDVFSMQLDTLMLARTAMTSAHELFEREVPIDLDKQVREMVPDAKITKYTVLLLLRHSENEAKPNSQRLRRAVRSYRDSLNENNQGLYDKLQPAVRNWLRRLCGSEGRQRAVRKWAEKALRF